jgi:hypothetical protein
MQRQNEAMDELIKVNKSTQGKIKSLEKQNGSKKKKKN